MCKKGEVAFARFDEQWVGVLSQLGLDVCELDLMPVHSHLTDVGYVDRRSFVLPETMIIIDGGHRDNESRIWNTHVFCCVRCRRQTAQSLSRLDIPRLLCTEEVGEYQANAWFCDAGRQEFNVEPGIQG